MLRRRGLKSATVAVLLLLASVAGAASMPSILGGQGESATLALQQKAESLFEQGEYERVFFIYREELAPLADKYAQYMIGFMYLTGTGIAQDPLLASAWYRLAAERSYPEFVAIRDQLLGSFTESALAKSDEYYLQLRKEYSDLAILMRLVQQDRQGWDEQTGSRLAASTGTVMVVDPLTGDRISRTVLERRFRQRAKEHLELLGELLPDVAVGTDIRKVDVDQLQVLVDQQLAVIDDRTANQELAEER